MKYEEVLKTVERVNKLESEITSLKNEIKFAKKHIEELSNSEKVMIFADGLYFFSINGMPEPLCAKVKKEIIEYYNDNIKSYESKIKSILGTITLEKRKIECS